MRAPVRQLSAPPWQDDVFVAGGMNEFVDVYSMREMAKVTWLRTILDFGGSRLAITPGGAPVVMTGAWARHGVRAYGLDRTVLWQKKDRSRVQGIEVVSDDVAAISYEGHPTVVVETSTGTVVRELRGVRNVYAIDPDISVLVSRKHFRFANSAQAATTKPIALESFAVLDVAGGHGHIAVAEAGGPLRLFDLEGTQRGHHLVPRGHVLHVAHDSATRTWVAIARDVQRGPYSLLRLDDNARVLEDLPFGGVITACKLAGGRATVYADEDGLHRLSCNDLSVEDLNLTAS